MRSWESARPLEKVGNYVANTPKQEPIANPARIG